MSACTGIGIPGSEYKVRMWVYYDKPSRNLTLPGRDVRDLPYLDQTYRGLCPHISAGRRGKNSSGGALKPPSRVYLQRVPWIEPEPVNSRELAGTSQEVILILKLNFQNPRTKMGKK